MIAQKDGEINHPGTEELFSFLSHDKPCGELLAPGENCIRFINISDEPNSLVMFLEIQSDIKMKCHVTAYFMLKCRNQFHAKSCCLSDREKSIVLLTI